MFDQYNSGTDVGSIAAVHSQSQRASSQSQSQDQLGDEISQRTVLENGLAYESMNYIYNELVQETRFQEKTNELNKYLIESVENSKLTDGPEYDVLSYWKVSSAKYWVFSQLDRGIYLQCKCRL